MISVLTASVLMIGGFVAQQQPVTPPVPSLIVTGTAEIRTAPDLATLVVGVTSEAKRAQDAQNDANHKTADFLSKVKTLIGNKGTVQTSNINLSPVYNQPGPNGNYVQQIVGYRADNSLSIRLTDFSLVGPVIDTAVVAGLNDIQSVSFGLQDDTDARLQALGDAVKQARKKADVMATAAGITITGVWEISEQNAQVMPFQGTPMMARAEGGATPTPVEAGDVVTDATVTIKFFVK